MIKIVKIKLIIIIIIFVTVLIIAIKISIIIAIIVSIFKYNCYIDVCDNDNSAFIIIKKTSISAQAAVF